MLVIVAIFRVDMTHIYLDRWEVGEIRDNWKVWYQPVKPSITVSQYRPLAPFADYIFIYTEKRGGGVKARKHETIIDPIIGKFLPRDCSAERPCTGFKLISTRPSSAWSGDRLVTLRGQKQVYVSERPNFGQRGSTPPPPPPFAKAVHVLNLSQSNLTTSTYKTTSHYDSMDSNFCLLVKQADTVFWLWTTELWLTSSLSNLSVFYTFIDVIKSTKFPNLVFPYRDNNVQPLILSILPLQCHLHPLQAANCCRNSRLVMDEDDLKWVQN